MIYCAKCTQPLMNRTLLGHQVELCPGCGAIYEFDGKEYHYVGTTNGMQQMRELLPITDEEVQNNETMALETNTFT